MEIQEFIEKLKEKMTSEIAWLGGERNKDPEIMGMKKAFSQIDKWIKELSKLHQPTVISAVCNSPCCKEVGVFELPLGSEWYCKEHYKQTDL